VAPVFPEDPSDQHRAHEREEQDPTRPEAFHMLLLHPGR
jgi:hypothetical protein